MFTFNYISDLMDKFKDRPYIIYCDNSYILPMNIDSFTTLVKDETNKMLIYTRTNSTGGSSFGVKQKDHPFESLIVPIELIWFIKVFNTKEQLIEFMNDKTPMKRGESIQDINDSIYHSGVLNPHIRK